MGSGAKLRVLVADDHDLVREGVRRIIEQQPDMQVAAEARNATEAIHLARQLTPEIALVDVSMPDGDGPSLARMLVDTCPRTRVIAVTRHTDQAFVTRMLQAGAAGYVLKQSIPEQLTRAVRAVAAGATYVDPSVDTKIPSSPTGLPIPVEPAEPLTPIEEHVLKLMAAAYSAQEMARHLQLDSARLAEIRDAAMRKLGLETRVQVIRYAKARGWS